MTTENTGLPEGMDAKKTRTIRPPATTTAGTVQHAPETVIGSEAQRGIEEQDYIIREAELAITNAVARMQRAVQKRERLKVAAGAVGVEYNPPPTVQDAPDGPPATA